jgi:hypothetical protein
MNIQPQLRLLPQAEVASTCFLVFILQFFLVRDRQLSWALKLIKTHPVLKFTTRMTKKYFRRGPRNYTNQIRPQRNMM